MSKESKEDGCRFETWHQQRHYVAESPLKSTIHLVIVHTQYQCMYKMHKLRVQLLYM